MIMEFRFFLLCAREKRDKRGERYYVESGVSSI